MVHKNDMYEQLSLDAEQFSINLYDMIDLNKELITFGLNHKYDVIVSEAIDFIILRKLFGEFKLELRTISKNTESNLVLCRLRLCDAVDSLGALDLTEKYGRIASDFNFFIWDLGGKYIETGDMKYVKNIVENASLGDERLRTLSENILETSLELRKFRIRNYEASSN